MMWHRKIKMSRKLYSSLARVTRTLGQNVKLKNENQSDMLDLSVGKKIHGFEVKQVKEISEFNIKAFYLEHEKTKAQYLHLYRDDNNNAFSINFRTTPMDSSGKPHILEHLVLCGSEQFPVRDPFFQMMSRSLATFMNAMTGSDYTLYPFSSQNYSDYRNLQKIYLDAVFSPKLSELDFMQEGWRLENVDLKDSNSELIIKGVVYNEMKGVFSENDNIFAQQIQSSLLPDHTYGVISGGDPLAIPNLTWSDLKQFHKEHYYPSNCRCFSYGNFPVLPTLQYINDNYFTKYSHSPPTNTIVPRQKRWSAPKREHIKCRFDPMAGPIEKQNTLAICLLVSDCTDSYETFLMHFISELLVKGPNSAFYKSMIEPNISGGFIPATGHDSQVRDTVFTVGLKGLKKEDFDRVINIYNRTITEVIDKGFEPEHIESVLHNYELLLKHETSNFGLNLLFGLTPVWNHTYDVISYLQINSLIDLLKGKIKNDPKYLQNIVKKYFGENQHRLTLTMSPDPEYEKNLEKQEKDVLNKVTKKLSESDRQNTYEKCLKLQEAQKSPGDVNLLPMLVMDDISSDVSKVDKIDIWINQVPTQVNQVNSNGIIYYKSILNTNELTQEQHMLLPLFCYVITKLGTDLLNYKEFDSLMSRKTSSFNLRVQIAESLYDLHTYEPAIMLSSYCLEKNVDTMWELWKQIFNISKLNDVDRFKMLTQLYMTNLTEGIIDAGHIYSMQSASSLISSSAYQVDLMSGLQHISYMKRLIHTSSYKALLSEILDIAKILLSKKHMRIALNVSPESRKNVLRTCENFLSAVPDNRKESAQQTCSNTYVTGKSWTSENTLNCQHHILNVPINYCSKAVLTVPFTHPDYAKLKVLGKLLSTKYLHPELREKQGAYGSGTRLTYNGVLAFFSYRDPRNLETLDIFDNSHKWFTNNLPKLTDDDILGAKLGVFQAVDAPIPPEMKGCDEFSRKLTHDILQRHRGELMAVEKKGLEDVCNKYLGNTSVISSKVILGPKSEKVDGSKKSNEIWSVVENI